MRDMILAQLEEAGFIPASPSASHARNILSAQTLDELARRPCVICCSAPRGAADRLTCARCAR